MSNITLIVEQKEPKNNFKFSPQNLAASENSVYYRMLKAGVHREAVKQKMIVLGRVERALAENLIDYLVTLLNNEENIEKKQVEIVERVLRSTLKKSTKKISQNSSKLTEKEVENCSYYRMLKSGVPTGAVIQKMVVLERINLKEAEKTVNSYLELLNAPKEVQSNQNKNLSEISQGNLNSFYQMLKSGVPSLAVKQKMIVLHKISSEKADQIIEHFFAQIDRSSDQFFSENIIDLSSLSSSSSSPFNSSFDRPQFKSNQQTSGKSEIKMVEIKENNCGKGKLNVKFNFDEKNPQNRVPKYDTYFHMIKVGMKSDVVKQRMKIDGVSIEKIDQLVNEIFDIIISTISSSSVPNNQKYYGEKLYRSMVEAGVPLNAVYHRMTVIDKLLPDVAHQFLNSIDESVNSCC